MTPQSRDVTKLCPCIRERLTFLTKILSFPLTVIETIRALDRQEYYIKIGASWTLRSKHLPQPPHHLALAFDAAPSEYLSMKLWNPRGGFWKDYGQAGEDLGLTWGGRWKQKDLSHLELSNGCECADDSIR